MPRTVLAVTGLTTILAAAVQAQAVPVVALSKPDVEFAEPFDQVTAVRELGDGRVVVADGFAKTVSLIDLRSGSVAPIGREGQGPGEYAFPSGLVAFPGDTTLIVDPVQRRLVKVAPNGKPVSLVSFPEGTGLAIVRGADSRGRIYLQGSPFELGLGSARAELPDSAPIIRWNPADGRTETLGRIKLPEIARASSGNSGSRTVVMRQQPYSPRDAWSVTPDGRVGIARVADYSVEWWGSSKVSGPVIAYNPVRVTQADKDEIKRRESDTRGRMMVGIGGAPRRGTTPPPPPSLPEPEWPEFKPAFLGDVLASPNGQLWVPRSVAAGAPRVYDVFDARGHLVRQVRLQPSSRLVGFGKGSVYVTRTDEDELQYLQRFRMP